ncbi:MAG: Type pilus pilin [Parcubacteria group bacterium]|nr:Type pilus pilin [Parcubacteria group bacterium]
MTIIELLVTISILVVVMGALMMLIQSFYKNNSYLVEETAALASARSGVGNAIVALREASYGDDGSYPIAAAATSTVTLYADLNANGSVERVTYTLQNGTLYRTSANSSGNPPVYPAAAQSTTTIATNVRNTNATPMFTYFDSTGTQLSTTSPAIAAISSVKVQVLVDLNPTRAPNVFTLTETATIRNLRSQ